ncbi:hypothetical protein SK128_026943, partial [Halocaridina rubra]
VTMLMEMRILIKVKINRVNWIDHPSQNTALKRGAQTYENISIASSATTSAKT